jgi:hypothetical protein
MRKPSACPSRSLAGTARKPSSARSRNTTCQSARERPHQRPPRTSSTLGLPSLTPRALAAFNRFARNIAPIIREIQATGVASHRGIARSLNARGIATARGGVWTAVQVGSILTRVGVSRKRGCKADSHMPKNGQGFAFLSRASGQYAEHYGAMRL